MENALTTQVTGHGVINSLSALFDEYAEKKEGIERIARFVGDRHDLISYFLTGNGSSGYLANTIFKEAGAIGALNSEFWSRAIDMTDVLECMPAKQRNEWSNMIHERKTPDFTKENVLHTLQGLLMSRGDFLAQKVDGIFRKLSGEHLTNSPMGFRKRMIVNRVLDDLGYVSYTAAEYIQDLRSVIAKIMKRDGLEVYQTRSDISFIAQNEKFGEWFDFDGGSFRMKIFKKGTAHMEVHQDIAIELNNILATLYPNAIPAGARKKDPKIKEVPLRQDFLQPEVINTFANLLDKNGTNFYLGKENAHKEKIEEILKFVGGIMNKDNWTFNYNAKEVFATIVRTGTLPDIKSHQYYPTTETLANFAVNQLGYIDRWDKVLEPSAGQGGLADKLPKSRTTCVEISEVNAAVLRDKGFNVICGDFLKQDFDHTFAKIIMNPPFNKGQAEAHVKRAAGLLSPEGTLVAILPASFRNKVLVPTLAHEYSEVIEGQFDDTGVSVVVLTLRNRNKNMEKEMGDIYAD